MRPAFEATPFRERRQQLAESLRDGLAIIPGAPAVGRDQDGYDRFRQRSDFFFLTGFDEPDAVAVLNPSGAQERFVLFVRPRDREMEIWNGHRAGTEGAIADLRRRRSLSHRPARRRSCASTPSTARRSTTRWGMPPTTRRSSNS